MSHLLETRREMHDNFIYVYGGTDPTANRLSGIRQSSALYSSLASAFKPVICVKYGPTRDLFPGNQDINVRKKAI